MGRPLRLALFPEGPTDLRFLGPVARRLTLSLLEGAPHIDVADTVVGLTWDGSRRSRPDRFADAMDRVGEAVDVVLIHADGAGDPDSVRLEQIDPLIARVGDWSPRRAAVAVVPVRETEAWALVDGDAIRDVLGSVRDDVALGLPKASRCETVTDPKACLDGVVRDAHARSRGGRKGARYLASLGERVSLGRLALLPSFQAFSAELGGALVDLGYLSS